MSDDHVQWVWVLHARHSETNGRDVFVFSTEEKARAYMKAGDPAYVWTLSKRGVR